MVLSSKCYAFISQNATDEDGEPDILIYLGLKDKGYAQGYPMVFGGSKEVQDNDAKATVCREVREETASMMDLQRGNVHHYPIIPVPGEMSFVADEMSFFETELPATWTNEHLDEEGNVKDDISGGKEFRKLVAVSVRRMATKLKSSYPSSMSHCQVGTFANEILKQTGRLNDLSTQKSKDEYFNAKTTKALMYFVLGKVKSLNLGW